MEKFDAAVEVIRSERLKQQSKWGVQSHGVFKWMAILMEEVGEATQAALERDRIAFTVEMVQVAAVAVQIVEQLMVGGIDVEGH